MNGNFFLDTNAIIQLLKGNLELCKIVKNANLVACSVISELEYFSFPGISENDISLFIKFLSRIKVIDVLHNDSELKKSITIIRKTKKVKLPDAIILASAKLNNCQLVTADKELLKLNEYADIINFNLI